MADNLRGDEFYDPVLKAASDAELARSQSGPADEYVYGFVAGLVASIASIAVLWAFSAATPSGRYDFIGGFARGTDGSEWAALLLLLILGTWLGGWFFTFLIRRLPGRSIWLRAVLYGLILWAFALVFLLPWARAGFAGLGAGPVVPLLALIPPLVFALVAAAVYQFMLRRRPRV